MLDKLMDILVEFDAALITPLTQAFVQVTVLALSNLTFYKIVHEHLHEAIYFTPLALCFGLFHLFLLASVDLVVFSFFTAIFFAVFLHVATFLNELVEYTCETILKVFVFCYALVCFRFWTDKEDFDEYIVTFIVMTVKLLCASEELQKKSWEEKTYEHGLMIQTFTLTSYLTYTAWVSYKDFLILRNKRHEKRERWWNMICSAGSRVVLYKVLSYKLINDNIVRDFWLKDHIFWIIKAFQCRCKYYYRAQIAELEVIAAGVKKGGWTKHCMFNFERAEFSVIFKDFLIGINTPLSTFMRSRFTTKTHDGLTNIFKHIALFLFLLLTYNVHIACVWFWFFISIYTQESVFRSMVEVGDICLFSCKTEFCFHKYGRRRISFHIIKYALIILNHFRLSLLFVYLSSAEVSLTCTFTSVVVDLLGVTFLLLLYKPKYQYFSLLNKARS